MNTAVIVGRFQTPELHPAHIGMLKHVVNTSDHTIIFIGVARRTGTRRNPLDFVSRQTMLLETLIAEGLPPNKVTITAILDQDCDNLWSDNLDSAIRTIKPPGEVTLVGGRDSFLQYYRGRYPTKTLTEAEVPEFAVNHSGTELRKSIRPGVGKQFREGAIYAVQNYASKVYWAVDIAVFKGKHLLMGRKRPGSPLRFPGGFVDPTDSSLEEAARRELVEETHLLVEPALLTYVGSYRMEDWRYRHEERLFTALFEYEMTKNCSSFAGDDLVDLEWVDYERCAMGLEPQFHLEPVHKNLFNAFVKRRQFFASPAQVSCGRVTSF